MCVKIIEKYNECGGNMSFKNIKDHLILVAETVASASPKVAPEDVKNFEKEHPNAFNWLAEEISVEDWRAFRKTMRNTQDIQQRWDDRRERNRLKQSVAGLGQDNLGKRI